MFSNILQKVRKHKKSPWRKKGKYLELRTLTRYENVLVTVYSLTLTECKDVECEQVCRDQDALYIGYGAKLLIFLSNYGQVIKKKVVTMIRRGDI